MHILVVEDEPKLSRYLKKGLEQQTYSVDCAFDGPTGEQKALVGDYDIIILDIMLPGKNGITVCKSLRQQGFHTPVLMLTAKGEVADKVAALDAGGDDYLVKPFDLAELLARIRALLRRPLNALPEKLTVRDLVMDVGARTIQRGAVLLELTSKEFSVLEYLLRNKGKLVTKEQIIAHCWEDDFDSFSNIVEVYIKRLRQKIKEGSNDEYIETVRGLGYRIAV